MRLSLKCLEFLVSKSANISIDLKVLFDICESISKVLMLSISSPKNSILKGSSFE